MHSRSSTMEDTDDLVLITMYHIRAVHFNGTWVRTVFQRYICLTDALCALFDWLPSMAHHVLSGLMRDHADVCENMLLFQVGQHGTPFVAGDVELLTVVFDMLCQYGFQACGYRDFVVAMDQVGRRFFLISALGSRDSCFCHVICGADWPPFLASIEETIDSETRLGFGFAHGNIDLLSTT